MMHNTGFTTDAAATAALAVDGPQPVWMTLNEAREHAFTGEIVFESDPEVLAYLDNGVVYYAERVSDVSLGRRLLDAGVVDVEQLERGTVRVGDVEHLGRLFDRDPSVDRDAVVVMAETFTEELIADLANRSIVSVRVTAYRHHPSGVHRWFVAPLDPAAVTRPVGAVAQLDSTVVEELPGLPFVDELTIEWDDDIDHSRFEPLDTTGDFDTSLLEVVAEPDVVDEIPERHEEVLEESFDVIDFVGGLDAMHAVDAETVDDPEVDDVVEAEPVADLVVDDLVDDVVEVEPVADLVVDEPVDELVEVEPVVDLVVDEPVDELAEIEPVESVESVDESMVDEPAEDLAEVEPVDDLELVEFVDEMVVAETAEYSDDEFLVVWPDGSEQAVSKAVADVVDPAPVLDDEEVDAPDGLDSEPADVDSAEARVEFTMPPLELSDDAAEADVPDDVAAAVRRAIAAIESAEVPVPSGATQPDPTPSLDVTTPLPEIAGNEHVDEVDMSDAAHHAPSAPAAGFGGFAPPTMATRAEVLYGQMADDGSTVADAGAPTLGESSSAAGGVASMAFADGPADDEAAGNERSSALRRLIGSLRRKDH